MASPAVPSSSSSSSSSSTPSEIPSTPEEELENRRMAESSPDAFFSIAWETISNSSDLGHLVRAIFKLTELTNKSPSGFAVNFCNYVDLLKIMLSWTNHCLIDPDISESVEAGATNSLNEALYSLFSLLVKVLNSYKKDSFETTRKNLRNVYTVEYLIDASSKFVSQLQSSNIVTATAKKTLPQALNVLFILGTYSHDFLDLDLFLRQIILIAMRVSSLNVSIANIPEWVQLLTRLHYCLDSYQWIEQQNILSQEELQELTCSLVEFSIVDGYSPESADTAGFCLFNNHFVKTALKTITQKFNQNASQEPIKQRNLFTFFQKEISELLVNFAIRVRHPNPLQVFREGMSVFGVDTINKELLRWSLPHFLVRLNEQTEVLLRGIVKFTKKPVKEAFECVFSDILIYIFFRCPNNDPVKLTYEVFAFCTRVGGENLFSFLSDSSYTDRFVEDSLKLYCVNPNRTYLAITFISRLNPIVHLDPELPESLLKVPVDYNLNSADFRGNIHYRFVYYIHRVDFRIMSKQETLEDKKHLIESYAQLMKHLGENFIKQFKMKIWFSVRTLFDYFSKSNPKLLKSVCKILEELVCNAETYFIQDELPSICCLILPYAKVIHKECLKVLNKIFTCHKFPKQVYYQLHFVSYENVQKPGVSPKLLQICELIRKETGIGNYDEQFPVLDVSNLPEFIEFIQSTTFSARCREVLFILDQVNYNNSKVQELALSRLYDLLSFNVDIYNQILSAKQEELKIYEDLSEVELDLLPDGHDSKSQYVLEFFNFLKSIDTVGKYFHTLIVQLLKCFKFVSREQASSIANCLGLLGAIDPKFLSIDRPCLSKVYKITNNNKSSSRSLQTQHIKLNGIMYSIDFCNQRPFRHQTREFKQIVLECLMKITKSAVSITDFTRASLAIQELMNFFANPPTSIIIDNDLMQSESGRSVNDNGLENCVTKLYAKEIQSSTTAQMEMMDNLEQVLAREKVECISKNSDLSLELYEYSTMLEKAAGLYNKKRPIPRNPITMDQFFENINPTMPYFTFLETFLQMLYHCFILKQSSESEAVDSKGSQHLDFHHIVFSQYNTQYQSSQSYTQEFKEIIEKLKTIKSPHLVFEICHQFIFSDPKLAHILFPSLLILSLSYADSKTIQKFSTHIRSMIQNKFLLNPQYFLFELGPQVAEFICFLFDFLVEFEKSRKKAHFFMVRSLVLRNRVNRFDSEYSSVSTLLKDIELLDMAKLAFSSGSYHKALFYLEMKFADKLSRKLPDAALNSFRQQNLEFLMRIYSEMGDEDSVKGCRLICETHMPTLENMLSTALVENNSLETLMISAQLVRNDNRANHVPGKPLTMEDICVQNKYFAIMKELHLNPSLSASRLINDLSSQSQTKQSELPNSWSSKAPLYMIDATWKLNQWEEMDIVANAFHSFGGISNSELSKLEQNLYSLKKKSCISFGSDNGMSGAVVPSIGPALLSLKKEEALFVFQSKLNDIRSNVLGHLKAALMSNQQSAYQRAYYNSIIPLHLIHDVQEFSQTIYEKIVQNQSVFPNEQSSDDDIFQCFIRLKTGWEARNRFVPLIAYDHSTTITQIIDVQRALVKILQQHSLKISPSNSDVYAVELFRYWAKGLATEIKCGNLNRAYANLLEATQLMTDLLRNNRPSLLDSLNSDERADFVLDSAKVHWCRRNERAALKMIKNELVKNYTKLEQVCFMETGKRYLSSSCETERIEIAHAIGLNVETTASRIINSGDSSQFNSKRSNSLHAHAEELARVNEETKRNPDLFKAFGRLQLQYARYAEECREFSTNSLVAVYKAVKVACPSWEEGYFSTGEYLSKLAKEYEQSMITKIGSETNFIMCKPEEILDFKARIIGAYSDSLKRGCKFLSISLPVMLNTWVELGYEERAFLSNNPPPYLFNIVHSGTPNRLKEHYKKTIEMSTAYIVNLTRVANNAIFLYAVDTLIAHLMHPNNDISRSIQNILVALCVDFPHHMAWHLSRSLLQNNRRGYVAKEILNKAALHENNFEIDLAKYNFNFRTFSNNLNELSRFKPSRSSKRPDAPTNYDFSLKKTVPSLVRTVESLTDFKFVIPYNKMFVPSLLNLERVTTPEKFHNFFSGYFIEYFEDQVQTMKSLQLPKKITVVCKDGVKRSLLCKSSDDLRKDRCFINYANLFNQSYGGEIPRVDTMRTVGELKTNYLAEERMIAKRRLNPLKLQTYFVCPLSDSYGVIEWIPGLVPMKVLVEEQYNRSHLSKLCYFTAKNNFAASIARGGSKPTKEKRIEIYIKSLPSFKPPVFHIWFQTQFADAFSWAMAKRNFIRTSAVYSVLGYVLGLGDRHSENLLFDPSTGEMVQVDFNCLFNRGEDFVVPECVPFRMSHNLEAAMGIIGFEGQFRHTAEDVLFILRQYHKLFAKYVTQFIHDPLVEWVESHSRNDQIEKSIFCVEARLSGYISRSKTNFYKGRQVSVPGQIDHIIMEASNTNNLGAMYQGWAAYI